MEVEREDRLLQVVIFWARDETEKLGMEERKESEYCLPDTQASVDSGFPGREWKMTFNYHFQNKMILSPDSQDLNISTNFSALRCSMLTKKNFIQWSFMEN